jgi:hypothetical protein
MALNDDERKTMVGLETEKAERFLKQPKELVEKIKQLIA